MFGYSRPIPTQQAYAQAVIPTEKKAFQVWAALLQWATAVSAPLRGSGSTCFYLFLSCGIEMPQVREDRMGREVLKVLTFPCWIPAAKTISISFRQRINYCENCSFCGSTFDKLDMNVRGKKKREEKRRNPKKIPDNQQGAKWCLWCCSWL